MELKKAQEETALAAEKARLAKIAAEEKAKKDKAIVEKFK
jgi:hypothetical protein